MLQISWKMFELVYVSIPFPSIDDTSIENILKESRKFNSENGITGCLVHHPKHFVQILEGDRDIVMGLFSKIQKDHRHHDVELLSEGTMLNRYFEDWSMAYCASTDTDYMETFRKNLVTFSELTDKPTKATKIFWGRVAWIMGLSSL